MPSRVRAPLAASAVLAGAAGALVLVGLVSLFAGSRETGIGDVVAVLAGGGDDYVRRVVDSRVPRTLLGAAVGAALAVSGVVIQGITRNPLGDPGLLGVTIGASAAVVTATALLGSTLVIPTVWVALPGSVVAVLAAIVLGGRGRDGGVVPLVLAGAVVSAVLGAYIQAMILTRPEVFDSYRFWVVGALAGRGLDVLGEVAPVLLIGFALAAALASSLNALALGDDVATALGTRVRLVRGGGLLAATLLASAATAAVGPVAFVGLAVPHIVRGLVGVDHRWQLGASAFLGGALLIGADVLGRVIARPEEIMVGVVTAFLGAPFLLWAVRRGRVMR